MWFAGGSWKLWEPAELLKRLETKHPDARPGRAGLLSQGAKADTPTRLSFNP